MTDRTYSDAPLLRYCRPPRTPAEELVHEQVRAVLRRLGADAGGCFPVGAFDVRFLWPDDAALERIAATPCFRRVLR